VTFDEPAAGDLPGVPKSFKREAEQGLRCRG
jgi:hypothetical protein